MNEFLQTHSISTTNLSLIHGDYFDGGFVLCQDEDSAPIDLTDLEIIGQIRDRSGQLTTDINIEKTEPENGIFRFWMDSTKTYAVPPIILPSLDLGCDCTDYFSFAKHFFDIRILFEKESINLNSADAGVFTSSTEHNLRPGDFIKFFGTTTAGINGNRYKVLTTPSPLTFTLESLTTTNASLGGFFKLLKLDTVIGGRVICFATQSQFAGIL